MAQPNDKNNNKNKKELNKSKKISHALSWALRHAALDIGLTMTPGGWVPVQQILESRHGRLKGITLADLEEVVATNNKQRFAMSMRPKTDFDDDISTVHCSDNDVGDSTSTQVLCIRANQGHSIPIIDPNQLLRKLTPDELLEYNSIVHGTYMEAWNSIQTQGLSRMNRTHIHFASGLPEEGGVISGMRRTCTVYIYIDPTSCIQDGIEFFVSENGVILTAGMDGGVLPPTYFSKVTDSAGNILLEKAKKKQKTKATVEESN